MRIIRSALLIAANLIGILAFSWPIYLPENRLLSGSINATWISALLGSVAALIIITQISDGLLDSKSVAIVSIMVALISALRLLGAGAVGVEPMWFLLILASRALGAQIGYATAVLAMLVSALLTGGIGPWLPFQIFAAGWIALAVHLLPVRVSGRLEIVALAIYGAVASLLFGALMDLQLWPWVLGTDTQLSYLPGSAVTENLTRFALFHFTTALAWDLPRAVVTALLISISGKAILHSLRRAKFRMNATASWRAASELSMERKVA